MRRWPIGTSRTWMHCKMRRRNVASRSKRSRRLSVPIPAFTGGHEPHEHRLITRIWYQTGAWVLEDDYDSEYRYAGRPLAALQGLDGEGRVIYLGTMSKVMFPGLRIGYMVVPE